MKLLIAEDNEVARSMLETVLGKWDYEVVSTTDGHEAYAALCQADAPQLAVLDWEMPGLDGPSLCRKLRRRRAADPLYLILLTARSGRGDLVRGLEAGADDYIAKPFDVAVLKARVDVGRRVISLQNDMRNRQKLQGALEMAGAVCHELNQPLQSVAGHAEILLTELGSDDPNHEIAVTIKAGVDRIGELTRRIMALTHYESKPYLSRRIVDLDKASQATGT